MVEYLPDYLMKTNFFFAAVIIAAFAVASCNNNESEVLAVRLDKNAIELVKGESVKLNASVVPAQDVEFTWFSQDEQYVTVDPDGVVTAVGLKREDPTSDQVTPVSVYVKYLNGADECLVTVLPLAPDKVEIDYDGTTVKMDPGETVQLNAKIYPEDADLTELEWTTDYAACATVDSKTGLVKGVAPGFATIRASYNDRIFDEINVQVNVIEPTSVAIDPSALTMDSGTKYRLKPVLTPANASGADMVWTSDDQDVVTVDKENGVVTAVAKGKATVRLQMGKLSGECIVTVK